MLKNEITNYDDNIINMHVFVCLFFTSKAPSVSYVLSLYVI